MERLVSEVDKKEFIENALSYISQKGWTISNVNDAFLEVTDYMEKNAVLKELSGQSETAQDN